MVAARPGARRDDRRAAARRPRLRCKGSVRAGARGEGRGVRVTAEATPHHFTLTDEAVGGYDTHAKMNPPLRAESDGRRSSRRSRRHHRRDRHRPRAARRARQAGGVRPGGERHRRPGDRAGAHAGAGADGRAARSPRARGAADRRARARPSACRAAPRRRRAADVTVVDPEREWKVDPQRFCLEDPATRRSTAGQLRGQGRRRRSSAGGWCSTESR